MTRATRVLLAVVPAALALAGAPDVRAAGFSGAIRQGLEYIAGAYRHDRHDAHRQRDEVAYGSYLVDAVGSCADCHGGSPNFH